MELVSILLKVATIAAFLGFLLCVVAFIWPSKNDKEIFGDYVPTRLIEFAGCCFVVAIFCLLAVLITTEFVVKVE